MLSLRELLT